MNCSPRMCAAHETFTVGLFGLWLSSMVGPACLHAAGTGGGGSPSRATLQPLDDLEGRVRLPAPAAMLNAQGALESLGFSPDRLRQFVDDRESTPDEEELLFKLLFRLPQIQMHKLLEWQQRDVKWPAVAADPAAHRGAVFRLDGRVRDLRRIALPPEAAERLGYAAYFRVGLHVPGASLRAVLCARAVPEAWVRAETLDEPAHVVGLLLKRTTGTDRVVELVFAADRVAWHPDRVAEDSGITDDHVLLASLGMDLGRFDEVRKTNRRPMEPEDGECFYQLLAAVGRAPAAELMERAQRPFELQPMLMQPEQQHGRLVDLRGTALRVQKIAIESEDIRRRFGRDHYYQMDVLVPLDKESVRLLAPGKADAPPAAKSKSPPAPVFEHNYPITCVTVELPPGFPQEDNLRQPVHMAGFYFKLWTYQSQYVSSFDDGQRQPAPLFVVTVPRMVTPAAPNPWWSWTTSGILVLGFGLLIVMLWRTHRGDRAHRRRARQRDDQVSFPS